jgi:hypothetical protein
METTVFVLFMVPMDSTMGSRLWLRPHRRPLVNPQHHRVVASPSLRRPLQAPGRPIIGHVAPHCSTNSRWAATPSAVLAPSLG